MKKKYIIYLISALLLSCIALFYFTSNQAKTIVIIVSDELSKSHMSIYGYPLETTPNLKLLEKNGELIVLTKTITNHSSKSKDTEALMTNATNESIISAFDKNGYETFLFGGADSTISSKEQTALLEKIAVKSNKDRLFFISLQGEAFGYCPAVFNIDTLRAQGYIGKKKIEKNVSLKKLDANLQNFDCFIKSIVNNLQQQPDNENSIWFTAERGVDLLSKNKNYLGFNTAHVPSFIWTNKTFKIKNKGFNNQLESNKNEWLGTSNFSNLLTQFSISNSENSLKINKHKPFHTISLDSLSIFNGKLDFKSPQNTVYYQQENAQIIKDLNQEKRIFPHRVNSIGKLNQIWNDGYRSFEIDVLFDNNKTKKIILGHNEGDTNVTLQTFLSFIEISKLDKIWLDFKNLSKDNEVLVFDELNKINEQYNIKDKVILETDNTEQFVLKFSNAGWDTTYYLPTTQILKLIADENEIDLKKLAISINKKITSQKINAVSFDNRLYPFVKNILEPITTNSIQYHIWYGPPLKSINFNKKLEALPFYNDERVLTILCSYHSEFNI